MTYNLHSDGTLTDATTDQKVSVQAPVCHTRVCVPHLAPQVITVVMPKKDEVKIRVAYSCHCFTEGYDSEKHGENNIIIMDGPRQRAFDRRRYDLSKGLPTLIAGLSGHHVWMLPPQPRRESSFTAFDAQVVLEGGAVYRVFFVLRKKKGRERGVRYCLELFVESAYPTDKSVTGMRIKFVTLVDSTLQGKKIKYNP